METSTAGGVAGDGSASTGRCVPTFAEIVPVVARAVPVPSRESYRASWNKVVAVWGERRLDEITVPDVQELVEYVKDTVGVRRSANGGRSAVETAYNALSCVYRHALDEGVIADGQNVMSRVAKPRRQHSRRHGLDAALVGPIVEVASSTGNDPALDALLLRRHRIARSGPRRLVTGPLAGRPWWRFRATCSPGSRGSRCRKPCPVRRCTATRR